MNIVTRTLLSAALFGALIAPMAGFAQAPAAPAAPPQRPAMVAQKAKGGEHHPHIRAAIKELQEAKRELQTANHDFGGHRVDAIKACDQAIMQLEQALKFDKK